MKRPHNRRTQHIAANQKSLEIWPLAEEIGLPDNYWVGRRIQDDLVPDNILVFPVRVQFLSRNLGNYHPRFVLDIATATRINLKIGDHHYLLDADECALIFPHQFHYGTTDGPTQDDESGLITITFELTNPKAIEPLRGSPRRLRSCDISLLEQVVRAYRNDSPLALSSLLARLLISLCQAPEISETRQKIPADNPARDSLLEKINAALYTNRNQSFTIETLAQTLGYSAHQLQSLFRKHVPHISLGNYIRNRRVSFAACMIQTTDDNITDISNQLGFSSIHSFSRLFKATYGVSPKQYEIGTRTGHTATNGKTPSSPEFHGKPKKTPRPLPKPRQPR